MYATFCSVRLFSTTVSSRRRSNDSLRFDFLWGAISFDVNIFTAAELLRFSWLTDARSPHLTPSRRRPGSNLHRTHWAPAAACPGMLESGAGATIVASRSYASLDRCANIDTACHSQSCAGESVDHDPRERILPCANHPPVLPREMDTRRSLRARPSGELASSLLSRSSFSA